MASIIQQIEAFLYTIVLGVLAGAMLHSYQLFVKRIAIRQYALYFVDIIFWLVMIVLIFASMLYINQGEMRSYVLIALIVGALIYYRFCSAKTDPLLGKIADINVLILQKTIKYLFYYPLDLIYRLKKIIIIYISKNDYDQNDKDK